MALKRGSSTGGTDSQAQPGAAAATPAGSVEAVPAAIITRTDNGQERPLSGGSYIRIDGKLTRQEA